MMMLMWNANEHASIELDEDFRSFDTALWGQAFNGKRVAWSSLGNGELLGAFVLFLYIPTRGIAGAFSSRPSAREGLREIRSSFLSFLI
jgi:hypothetical protein